MEDFPDFLYHYLVSIGVDARKQRLFADLKDRVRARDAVFDWLDNLSDAAEWYVALGDPNDELWASFAGAKAHVRELKLFRVDQYKPLVLALRERIRAKTIDVTSLLRMCAIVSLRATIIMRRNTADVLRAYQAAVKAALDGSARSVADLFESMSALYPSDEEFESSFASTSLDVSGPRKKLVKYLLCALEGAEGNTRPDFETDPASIEHILPENATGEWLAQFSEEDRSRFTQRVGNLTLLEPALNREAGNAPFETKRTLFAKSSYAMTKSIQAPEWTTEAIRERQRRLAKLAVRAFRLDY